jgi:hypothetical protein
MEVSGFLQAAAALLPGKLPSYPLNRKLVGPQSLPGRYGEEKNLAPAGITTAAVQPLALCYTD